MLTFPQLTEDDKQAFEAALGDLIRKSEALMALIVERAGYLIQQWGDADKYDTTQLANLAANSFNATEFMTTLLGENDFSSMYQQGEQVSTLILNIDHRCLLVIIFRSTLSVGVVKYYASRTIHQLAEQLQIADARAPGEGIDPALLNITDSAEFFKKREP
ncbi:MAG: roadblock/LC7 domain-containing protein [Limisphaerales bacterium]